MVFKSWTQFVGCLTVSLKTKWCQFSRHSSTCLPLFFLTVLPSPSVNISQNHVFLYHKHAMYVYNDIYFIYTSTLSNVLSLIISSIFLSEIGELLKHIIKWESISFLEEPMHFSLFLFLKKTKSTAWLDRSVVLLSF